MNKNTGNSTQTKRATREMSIAEIHSGNAVADYLSRRFPDNTAKRVARALPSVSVRTIEGWLRGNRPNGTHMDQLVALFGLEFVGSVWGAVLGPLDKYEAMERLRDVEQQIAELRTTIAAEVDRDQAHLPFE